MSEVKDGGAAFPRIAPTGYLQEDDPDQRFWERQRNGMSLRDWFAGMAAASHTSFLENNERGLAKDLAKVVAQNAYTLADALLKEREK